MTFTAKYSIGVDFGTESGRAVLVDVANGNEIATAVYPYSHGVINGKLHLGFGGTGGELGHTIIDYNGPPCGCGNAGCLEAYASGPAIAAMGMKAVSQGLTTKIAELSNHDLNLVTPKLIAEAAELGDEIAKDIFNKAGL